MTFGSLTLRLQASCEILKLDLEVGPGLKVQSLHLTSLVVAYAYNEWEPSHLLLLPDFHCSHPHHQAQNPLLADSADVASLYTSVMRRSLVIRIVHKPAQIQPPPPLVIIESGLTVE